MNLRIPAFLLALGLSATAAFALPTVKLSTVPGDSSGGTIGGGAFFAATQSEGKFKTFCLESSVGMNLGTTYFYSWSDTVQIQNDPISLGSALLMNHYARGILPGYALGGVGATALQKAFWYLENETGGELNAFVTYAQGILGGTLLNNANGAYGVRVMNLWANVDGTGDKQSQIVFVPDAGSTLALFGMVLALGAVVRSRRRRG
jgi:hypothetical protein